MKLVHNKITPQQFFRQTIQNTLKIELKMKFYTIMP